MPLQDKLSWQILVHHSLYRFNNSFSELYNQGHRLRQGHWKPFLLTQIYCRLSLAFTKMGIHLRSGTKVDSNGNEKKEEKIVSSKTSGPSDTQVNSRTTLVVFVGLLLDLLAFTLILPLFPALLDHYKKNDSSTGLYPYLVPITIPNYVTRCSWNCYL